MEVPVVNAMRRFPDWLSAFLFRRPGETRGARVALALFLAALFVAGAVHWVAFFDLGDAQLTAEDWPLQRMFFDVLKQAVAEGTIPWHTSYKFHGTARFLAIPEIALTPQLMLLPYLTPGRFMLANILLLYGAGFVGCLLLQRRYRMSPLAFALFFLLFNFNGHVTAHLGVGHPWYGYFLLPFFLSLVLGLGEGRTGAVAAIKIALLLFIIWLQASFHVVAWCLMLLLLIAIFSRAQRLTALLAILFTGLLSAFRIAPGFLQFHGMRHHFVSGYRSLYDLWEALVVVKEYGTFKIGGIFGRQGWWEYDLYVGILALAVIVYYGIVARWRKDHDFGEVRSRSLDLSLLIMFVLSLSYFCAFIALLPIPLINAERVSSRFMIIPLLFVALAACLRMQPDLERLERLGAVKWLAVLALMQIGFSLVNHSVRWSLMLLERAPYPTMQYVPSVQIVAQQDPQYKGVTMASAVVSLATLIILVGALVYCGLRRGRGGKAASAEA